jgi:hypothetical protein
LSFGINIVVLVDNGGEFVCFFHYSCGWWCVVVVSIILHQELHKGYRLGQIKVGLIKQGWNCKQFLFQVFHTNVVELRVYWRRLFIFSILEQGFAAIISQILSRQSLQERIQGFNLFRHSRQGISPGMYGFGKICVELLRWWRLVLLCDSVRGRCWWGLLVLVLVLVLVLALALVLVLVLVLWRVTTANACR